MLESGATAEMSSFRKFGGGIEEGTAAIAGPANPFGQRGEQILELPSGRFGMACHNAIPPAPVFLVPAREERRDQFFLGCEIPVEAHFGYAGALDNGIDADSADAFL